MGFRVAIIGRPNVGKSTLFNRLVGKKLALVDDQPGVTRDRREGEARLGDLRFTVIDTAGLDEAGGADTLNGRMRAQTEAAVGDADALTPASRRCSTPFWARSGCSPAPSPASRATRSGSRSTITGGA